jgi:hypothetical protein
MSNKSDSTVATIGIDIGWNSFHVVGLDRRGAIVLRQKWSRGQVEARLAAMSPHRHGGMRWTARTIWPAIGFQDRGRELGCPLMPPCRSGAKTRAVPATCRARDRRFPR